MHVWLLGSIAAGYLEWPVVVSVAGRTRAAVHPVGLHDRVQYAGVPYTLHAAVAAAAMVRML
jgi:hypothetical protein